MTEYFKKTELSKAVRNKIKDKEAELDKKCKKIWAQECPTNTYLFGAFKAGGETTIVTIAVKCDVCAGGWNPFC